MKKRYVILLVMILVLSLIVGCFQSNKEDSSSPANQQNTATESEGSTSTSTAEEDLYFNLTGVPISKEPIEVSVMFPRLPTHGDFEEMWFIKEVEEKLNIRLKIIPVEQSGWAERKALAFATGDLPDLFLTGLTSVDENTYGPQGLLISLTDLIDQYAPTAKQLLEKFPDAKKTFTNPNGEMYVLPGFNDFPRDRTRLRPFINNLWLDNLGLDMPTNLDELYTVLKAFKEDDPNRNGIHDEIPMSGTFKGALKLVILNAVGFVNDRHDLKNNEYVYVPVQDEYKEYLQYMNRLYAEELLDKEFFTQTVEQVQAKQQPEANRIGFYDWTEAQIYPFKDEITMISPLTSSVNSEKMWTMESNYDRVGTFAITHKNEYPEAMIRLVDYLLTSEGGILARGGPEYGKWDGEGGYEWTTFDNGIRGWLTHYEGFSSFARFRQSQILYNVPFYVDEQFGNYLTAGDPNGSWLTAQVMNSGAIDVVRMAYPEVLFTAEEQERIASFVDLDSYADQMEARFITGDAPFSQWDEYIANMKQMGLDEMTEIRQTAFDRWNSTN